MSPSKSAPLDLQDILTTLRVYLPELQERYGVRTLGLFGSYVRGMQKTHSDVDILVEFDDRPLTLLQIIELEYYLSDMLSVKVDLVEKEALKPAIGQYVLQEVIPV